MTCTKFEFHHQFLLDGHYNSKTVHVKSSVKCFGFFVFFFSLKNVSSLTTDI